MTDTGAVCPFCGTAIARDDTVCSHCNEDLSSLVRLEYEHAIHYNEALALAREGRFGEAHAKLVAALHLKDHFVPAHVLLAKVEVYEGQLDRARASIARAAELAPEDETVANLAEHIERMAEAAERERQESTRVAERAKRARAEKHWASYKRDLTRSFALGAAMVGVLMWLFGEKRRDDA